MTSQLKAKLLQHFAGKKANGGFTLIELLVVIIIIGILSAIALPSFLNQANKAKQSEAKTYVGSMNRAQQAYYLENSGFADTVGELGLGLTSTTANYVYGITSGATISSITNTADPTTAAAAALKSYAGGVGLATVSGTTDKTTIAKLCEASAAGTAAAALTLGSDALTCPADFTDISS
ncbi:MAG: type IV pilin-like G/H family protein [Cyanobacteria bacterium P01_D01_bin.105]